MVVGLFINSKTDSIVDSMNNIRDNYIYFLISLRYFPVVREHECSEKLYINPYGEKYLPV
jgi:hypothetical protein